MRIPSNMGCVFRTRWIFRLLLFVVLVTLTGAVFSYLRIMESLSESFQRPPHGANLMAGAFLMGGRFAATPMDEFIPGTYLAGRTPGSVHCNYSFWSPQSEDDDPWSILNWSKDSIKSSPELGVTSPYRVIYNVLNSSSTNKENLITYCTHATPEFLYHIAELLQHWDGLVSVTVYAPGEDAFLAVNLIHRLCRCIPDMKRVSLHIAYPENLPPKRGTAIDLPLDCLPPRRLSTSTTMRQTQGMTYPVNVARNAAREAATTQYVLVSDIELQPSANLSTQFAILQGKLAERRKAYLNEHPNALPWTGAGFVYVLPVFEIELGEMLPNTKEELLKLYSRDKAVFFHRWVCPHCQKFPGLLKWIHKTGTPGFLQPLLVVRREYPFHRWEPVYIGTKREPLYSEVLSWEGMQDKMTQMDAMCLQGYKFVILDRGFLVHSPGIKRRAVVQASSAWRKPHEQQNTKLYREIAQGLLANQKRPNNRCKVQ